MSWIRLEAASGLRIMAPSFSPPPRMEGIDKLFSRPIHARAFHCFRSCNVSDESDSNTNNDGVRVAVEVLVLVQRQQVGGKLGEVCIAVGSAAATRSDLAVLLECALEAVLRSNNDGTRLILDALCAPPSVLSTPFSTTAAGAEVAEYDGLPTAKSSPAHERRVGGWRAGDVVPSNSKRRRDTRRVAVMMRRRALLYFVGQDVVPVSLLFCRVSSTGPDGCTSSTAAAQQNRKDLQPLAKSAACACRCLLGVLDRTLVAAFDVKDNTNQLLWSGGEADKPPLVAAFSTSGLLFGSPSFFHLTDHRDRLFLAAVAMDRLSRWSIERDTSTPALLVHVCELLLRCRKEGLMMKFVFVSVGSAVSCVLGFLAVNEGTLWSAETWLQFVKTHLATQRTSVMLSNIIEAEYDGIDDDDGGAVGDAVDIEPSGKENVGEFTPHLLLCVASLHPTPWFHRILHEMHRVEESTPKAALMGANGTRSKSTPHSAGVSCNCLPLFVRRTKKGSAPRRFIWHTDAADLPLDMAWCVAASHIVRAEAEVCSKGYAAGHHSLFSMLCDTAEDHGSTQRYGVGWFQHCWRTASCARNAGDDHNGSGVECYSGCSHSSTAQVNPTKLLCGLSSIGGGPRASVHYEVRERGGCFPSRRPKVSAHTDDDAPVFTSQATVFPYSLLFEEDNGNGPVLAEEVDEGRWMTAFYAVGRHCMKGASRETLLQEMLLVEGDQAEREENVAELLGQQHRSASNDESFAACRQAACCVLEEVWRYTTS
ncbi:hypothetical protein DQ04_00521170 [Trypanosoma grayi]|uniref:hypothetical protein n=1 Tax=Trypanosoma grayi TaxID=71804 RepID=UPI0004F42C36|nr:hypothetical protein DQ04_00521170 [Trypanosoma grayi]KEG14332.1 hypothetical protein DQ04_00521170 [Trypanosoma grayi]